MPFIVDLFRSFAISFTLSLLVISFFGLLVAYFVPESKNVSTLFALGHNGLTYSTIFQIACLALIIALIIEFLLSDRFFIKMRYLLRYFIFYISVFIATIIFVVAFKWFPVDNLIAWVSFTLSVIACYAISSAITFIILKKQTKKYNKLLENYKAKA
jgi:hypothetical protein